MKGADVTVDGVQPFCWANDFLVPIFVPGRTYEHAALPDCDDTAVVIFAFALALIKEYVTRRSTSTSSSPSPTERADGCVVCRSAVQWTCVSTASTSA